MKLVVEGETRQAPNKLVWKLPLPRLAAVVEMNSIPMILQKRMEKLLLTPLMKGLKLMWKGVE
ncbi:hypothetical protein N9280_00175 [bacterium]|nr:hypothetical protein [bacterium]